MAAAVGGERKERRKRVTECATLLSPTLLKNGIEISVHTLPVVLQRELKLVMPGQLLTNVLAIPTC